MNNLIGPNELNFLEKYVLPSFQVNFSDSIVWGNSYELGPDTFCVDFKTRELSFRLFAADHIDGSNDNKHFYFSELGQATQTIPNTPIELVELKLSYQKELGNKFVFLVRNPHDIQKLFPSKKPFTGWGEVQVDGNRKTPYRYVPVYLDCYILLRKCASQGEVAPPLIAGPRQRRW